MSLVNITQIQVLNNPAPFTASFNFEITFECNGVLKDDLEWKLIYVGSPDSAANDIVLDSILVGPIPVGVNKFTFTADAPKVEALPKNDIVGVTVVLLCCLYMDKEFVRVGYYVNNEYVDEELREHPPEKVQIDKLSRNILSSKPKVTRYTINWDNPREDPVKMVIAANENGEDAMEEDPSSQTTNEEDMMTA